MMLAVVMIIALQVLSAVLYYSALALALFGLVDLLRRYYQWRTSPLHKAPGPPRSSFFLGYMWTIYREPFMDPHKRWWSKLLVLQQQQQSNSSNSKDTNNIPLMAYSSLLGKWSVCILDPDLVKLVLTDPAMMRDPVRFPKNYHFVKEIIGSGLVTLEGEAWSRHRRIIQPSFRTEILREALNQSVPLHTNTLIEAWKKTEGRSTIIDLSSHMSLVTLDVIGDVAFSHDFGASKTLQQWAETVAATSSKKLQDKNEQQQQCNDDDDNDELQEVSDPLIRSFNASLKITGRAIVLTVLGLGWMDKYMNRKARETRRVLNEAVDNVIREARAAQIRCSNKNDDDKNNNGGSSSRQKSQSLLQLLLEATDADPAGAGGGHKTKLSDLELRDEIKTFIMAGHETTSTWCYWALYALAKYPDVQEKVYNDIIKHAAPDTSQPVTLEQVEAMSYFDAFLSEILRLYSPVGMLVRFTSRDETFCGYTIPANTRLVIPLHLLHRHPDHWMNPDDFWPERWLDPQANTARHRFCYLPFSAGGRSCVGQRFAEMEARLIIANVVRAFSMKLAPCMRDKDITFTNFITMKAKPAIKICVKRRS